MNKIFKSTLIILVFVLVCSFVACDESSPTVENDETKETLQDVINKITEDAEYSLGLTNFNSDYKEEALLSFFNEDGDLIDNLIVFTAEDNESLQIKDYQQTSDGGYIVTGNVDAGIDKYVKLVKVNSSFSIKWELKIDSDVCAFIDSIMETTDLGYIITGRKDNEIGGNQLILKIDKDGKVEWEKEFCPVLHSLISVVETELGGYIIAGDADSSYEEIKNNRGEFDAWVIALDDRGEVLWQKNYGGERNDYIANIQKTNDGQYILIGSTYSDDQYVEGNFGNKDLWVLKIDTKGKEEWNKCYGGSGIDTGEYICNNENGYVLVGATTSYHVVLEDKYFNDLLALEIDNNGEIIWQNYIGGSKEDKGNYIYPLNDKSFLLIGETRSQDGDLQDIGDKTGSWLLKLDNTGQITWQDVVEGNALYFNNVEMLDIIDDSKDDNEGNKEIEYSNDEDTEDNNEDDVVVDEDEDELVIEEDEDNENNNEEKDTNNDYIPSEISSFSTENIPLIRKQQTNRVVYEDDYIPYGEIPILSTFVNNGFKIEEISAAVDEYNVYFKIIYISPKAIDGITIKLKDKYGLFEQYDEAIKKGENTLVIKFGKKEILTFKASISIDVGDVNPIILTQAICESLARSEGSKEEVTTPEIVVPDAPENDYNETVDIEDIPVVSKNQSSTVSLSDDGISYKSISYSVSKDASENDYRVNHVGIAIDDEFLYLKVKFYAPSSGSASVFLASNTPGLSLNLTNCIKKGDNTLIFKFDCEVLLTYNAGIVIEMGERNLIYIEKSIIDSAAKIVFTDDDYYSVIPMNTNYFTAGHIPYISKNQNGRIAYQNDGIAYGEIPLRSSFANSLFVMIGVSAAYDDDNVYFKIRYISPVENSGISYRTPSNRDLFPIVVFNTPTKKGLNTIILKFSKDELLNYKSSVNIEVGDDNSIQLDQSIIEAIARK